MRKIRRMIVVLLGVVLGASSAGAETVQPSLVRIHVQPVGLYRQFTVPCADALKETLSQGGIAATIDESRAFHRDDAQAGNIDIRIAVTGGQLDRDTPPLVGRLGNISPFRDLRQFGSFIGSASYQKEMEYTEDFPSEQMLSDPIFQAIGAKYILIGLGYAASAQLFTGDRPLVKPSDLRGRDMLASFATSGGFLSSKKIGFGYDAALNHVRFEADEQKKAVAKFTAGKDLSDFFIVAPFNTAADILSPEQRKYVSLANWHIMTVSFDLELRPNGSRARFDAIKRYAGRAALACSQTNFVNEKKARVALEGSGTTVVPVDLDAFISARHENLVDSLEIALRKYAAAKKVSDARRAKEEIAAKKEAARKARQEKEAAKQVAKQTAQPPQSGPSKEVTDLLNDMKSKFNFDEDAPGGGDPDDVREDMLEVTADRDNAKNDLEAFDRIRKMQ